MIYTSKTAVPQEFEGRHCHSLENLKYERKSGKLFVSKHGQHIIDDFVSEIIKRTRENFDNRSINWNGEDEEENRLLFNTKSNDNLPSSCMIKVDAYDDVYHQRIFCIVGRKGTGKSTLLETIKRFESGKYRQKYKTLCPIIADDINLSRLYDTNPRLKKLYYAMPHKRSQRWHCKQCLCVAHIRHVRKIKPFLKRISMS